MEISKVSGLWSNIKKYDKTLTTFHLQHFFKEGPVFSEHLYLAFHGMHSFLKNISHILNNETPKNWARSKAWKAQNFVSDFFSSDFSILTKYPKSKTRKKKTWKKNSEVSESAICHFLEFLIKCPRFKFQFS